MEKNKIKLKGYYGSYSIIDTLHKYGNTYYILESEQYGDESNGICVRYIDNKFIVVFDDFYDRETLYDLFDENPTLR